MNSESRRNSFIQPKVLTTGYRALTEKACASIRFRTRKEILEDSPDNAEYLDDILDDERVKNVLTWQKADGYLGDHFHGGFTPERDRKHPRTGAEGGLRFLAEMGIPSTYPAVDKALRALLKDGWNRPGTSTWALYKPELGLLGFNHARAVVFAKYGIEDHNFIETEILRALDYITEASQISSVKDITGVYQNKLFFNRGIFLPSRYQLKMLAFTKGWRNKENIDAVAKGLAHLIELSPLPSTHIKYKSQLMAPIRILRQDFKKSLNDFHSKNWYQWFCTVELFARMGVVEKMPVIAKQVKELKEILVEGSGFFHIKPYTRPFQTWNVNSGLALEGNWKNDRWKYDLTFRALLILKYSGML